MYPQVLIIAAAAAAAALIKECLSPHRRSHAAVWQITLSLILIFAERHSDIRWPSTTMAKKKGRPESLRQ